MLNPEEDDLTDAEKDALREDLRRFWGRVVYFLGMMAGFIPIILLPSGIFSVANNNPASAVLVQAFNCLTVLPASVLAYWQRKVAAWWLIVDAAAIFFVALRYAPGGPVDRWQIFLLAAVPLFLGGFGLFAEMKGWPRLLDRKKAR